MDDTAAAIRAIAAELAAKPVAADLMERASNPIREAYQRSESQNAAVDQPYGHGVKRSHFS